MHISLSIYSSLGYSLVVQGLEKFPQLSISEAKVILSENQPAFAIFFVCINLAKSCVNRKFPK